MVVKEQDHAPKSDDLIRSSANCSLLPDRSLDNIHQRTLAVRIRAGGGFIARRKSLTVIKCIVTTQNLLFECGQLCKTHHCYTLIIWVCLPNVVLPTM